MKIACVQIVALSNLYLVDHAKVIQCNVRDITARKLAEAGVQRANEKLSSMVTVLRRRDGEMILLNRMNELLQTCETQEEAYRVLPMIAAEGGKCPDKEESPIYQAGSQGGKMDQSVQAEALDRLSPEAPAFNRRRIDFVRSRGRGKILARNRHLEVVVSLEPRGPSNAGREQDGERQ